MRGRDCQDAEGRERARQNEQNVRRQSKSASSEHNASRCMVSAHGTPPLLPARRLRPQSCDSQKPSTPNFQPGRQQLFTFALLSKRARVENINLAHYQHDYHLHEPRAQHDRSSSLPAVSASAQEPSLLDPYVMRHWQVSRVVWRR